MGTIERLREMLSKATPALIPSEAFGCGCCAVAELPDYVLVDAALAVLPALLAVAEAAKNVQDYGPECDCIDPICNDDRRRFGALRVALAALDEVRS